MIPIVFGILKEENHTNMYLSLNWWENLQETFPLFGDRNNGFNSTFSQPLHWIYPLLIVLKKAIIYNWAIFIDVSQQTVQLPEDIP